MEIDTRPCLVLTTWPADQPVLPLAHAVLEAGLAACVHIAAAGSSVYRWEGAIETAAEQPLVIKTTRHSLARLEAHVRAAHPYALPEWLVVEVTGAADYLAWIAASVAGRTESA